MRRCIDNGVTDICNSGYVRDALQVGSCVLETRKTMKVLILSSQVHVNMQWKNTKIYSGEKRNSLLCIISKHCYGQCVRMTPLHFFLERRPARVAWCALAFPLPGRLSESENRCVDCVTSLFCSVPCIFDWRCTLFSNWLCYCLKSEAAKERTFLRFSST